MEIIKITGRPDSQILNSIFSLYCEVFDAIDETYFYERLNSRFCWLTLLAYEGEKLVGFKMGYALDADTFYSWLGGVRSSCRKQGIGQILIDRQLQQAEEMGYSRVRTKTRNRFREMLILNLRNGFDVVDCYVDRTGEHKITLEKRLGDLVVSNR
ncbi:MAG: GNAT family N-acetyltransferase [Marinifilaceae bacterium]